MRINSLFKKMFSPTIIFLVLAHVGVFVLGVVSVWAYSDSGYKRSGSSVSYNISSVFASSFHTAIKAADATWDGAGAKFTFTYAGTTTRSATSYLGKSDSYNDILYYNSGSTGKVAATSSSKSGSTLSYTDTTLNTYYTFTTVGASGQFDVQDDLTHEFGHWLRLLDLTSSSSPSYCSSTSTSEATMCGASYTSDTRRRSLTSDDISGIKAIYGSK